MQKANKKSPKDNLKKEYNKRRKLVSIMFNSSEQSLLEIEMKKVQATATASFIKYKLFGMDSEEKFQRKLNAIATNDDIKIILKNEIEELNNAIDYINLRFNREIDSFEQEYGNSTDQRTIAKRVAILNDWQVSLQNKTDKIFLDLQTILKRMDIIVERKKQENLRAMPQSLLDEYVKNWNDTTSPEVHEAGRRMLERTKKETKK